MVFLTPLSVIFKLYRGDQFYWWRKPEYPEETLIFQSYRWGQIHWWRKPEYPENTTDLSLVTDKLYNITLYRPSVLP